MDRSDRHIEISKNLLKLSRNLLKEATIEDDNKVNELAVIFLIINGVFLDKRSFTKLYNHIKLFSSSELFENLMKTDLRSSILEKIKEASLDVDTLNDDFETVSKEIYDKLDYIPCICDVNNKQPYDGTKYPEYKDFCLNCGGKID